MPAKSTSLPTTNADEKREPVASGLFNALKEAGSQWVAHKSSKAGAALAYYSIFSMGPLIVVIVSIAALVFQREGVQQEVTDGIRDAIGDQGAESVRTMLGGAGTHGEGLFATIIGAATLLFAAVGVVVQLKDALNSVWEVEPKPRSGVWGFIRGYVLSFAGVLTVGFLLMISMMLTAALAAVGKYMGNALPEPLMQVLAFGVSFLTTSTVFALIFKWMPDTHVAWRDVILGALGTAVLFEIGKFAIGFYIGKQGLESSFGASASIVVVLIWVYYSSQILLFGAEFTRARARQRES
ncbi:MAG: YihY/virulence factor BrkB family protein [Enhydrobacter sp.]|nr:YihY/virulence factor BrkB family protein [Enhydrobacter sp.]